SAVLLHCYVRPASSPSFPTRRSSDLIVSAIGLLLVVGWVIEPHSLTMGLPLGKTWQTAATDLRHAADRFSTVVRRGAGRWPLSRSEEHTSELQSRRDLVCRLLLEKKN